MSAAPAASVVMFIVMPPETGANEFDGAGVWSPGSGTSKSSALISIGLFLSMCFGLELKDDSVDDCSSGDILSCFLMGPYVACCFVSACCTTGKMGGSYGRWSKVGSAADIVLNADCWLVSSAGVDDGVITLMLPSEVTKVRLGSNDN